MTSSTSSPRASSTVLGACQTPARSRHWRIKSGAALAASSRPLLMPAVHPLTTSATSSRSVTRSSTLAVASSPPPLSTLPVASRPFPLSSGSSLSVSPRRVPPRQPPSPWRTPTSTWSATTPARRPARSRSPIWLVPMAQRQPLRCLFSSPSRSLSERLLGLMRSVAHWPKELCGSRALYWRLDIPLGVSPFIIVLGRGSRRERTRNSHGCHMVCSVGCFM
mmetsp:Transcript_17569/g.41405  ORF Transcript_17569/g.41405 Transcript_17569/m.41405 type:complete len:221 (+) Transcript_17569:2865-3527(+)